MESGCFVFFFFCTKRNPIKFGIQGIDLGEIFVFEIGDKHDKC